MLGGSKHSLPRLRRGSGEVEERFPLRPHPTVFVVSLRGSILHDVLEDVVVPVVAPVHCQIFDTVHLVRGESPLANKRLNKGQFRDVAMEEASD